MKKLKLWHEKEWVENKLAYEEVVNIHLCKDWLVMYAELEVRAELIEQLAYRLKNLILAEHDGDADWVSRNPAMQVVKKRKED